MNPGTINEFFAELVTSKSTRPLELLPSCDTADCFNFRPLTTISIEQLLASVRVNTAPGHDGIPGSLIKRLAPALARNITLVMNSSLLQKKFPTSWKQSNVTAIWKGKGSKTDPANYRPISVLPILARVFEKACTRQLSRYVEGRDLLPLQQFGFRAKSSCEHALIAGIDSWMASIDNGEIVGSLMIDLSKAFDSVPHQMLLQELLNIGCSQSALEWFYDYLINRLQRVTTASSTTEWKAVGRGVPQGSCLSPLLFNIFVRELPGNCSSPTVQFADDVTHAEAANSPEIIADKLTSAYLQTKTFCEARDLKINASKSQFIVFKAVGKKLPENYHISLDGCEIQPSKEVKLLGIILDQHLTFKNQIDAISQKGHGLLGVLARSAKFLPTELLRMTYIALVRSQMEYCSSIFATAAQTHLYKLDVIQKMAARIISRSPRNSHSAPILEQLNLESLSERRTTHVINLVKQFLAGDCHPSLMDMFQSGEGGRIEGEENSRRRIGKRRFSEYGRMLYNSSLS